MLRLRSTWPLVLITAALLALPAGAEVQNPNHGRGFSPEKSFEIGEVDHVNLFNGTLNLTIPIGPTYPLAGGMSYSLTLTYGSSSWEWDSLCKLTSSGMVCSYRSFPSFQDNAGFGWQLHMGRLTPPNSPPRNSSPYWMYQGLDGATHLFYATLHEGDPAVAGTSYTRDGSFLRLKQVSGGHHVEFPDGTVHELDAAGELVKMRNRFPTQSWVTVARSYDAQGKLAQWTIQDSVGRVHTAHFEPFTILENGQPLDVDNSGFADENQLVRLTEVRLAGFGGTTRVWDLQYQDESLASGETAVTFRAPRVDDTAPVVDYTVPVLTSLVRPDGSSWFIGKNNYDFEGKITRLQYPTLGKVEWSYGRYTFPKIEVYDKTPPTNTEDPFTRNFGVIERRVKNAANLLEGTWRYSPTLVGDRSQTQVTDPLGNKRLHHFRTVPDATDYGLPYAMFNSDGAGRFISVETFDSAGVKKRSEYLRYEWDFVPFVDPLEPQETRWNLNRRVASRRTVYHDDAGRTTETDMSDFDGLGNYRRTVQGGSFTTARKTSRTDYNAARGTYLHTGSGTGHTFTMLPSTSPWLLGLYTESWTEEGGTTFKRQACFNTSNGFLGRERLMGGSAPGSKDLLRFYFRDSLGNRTGEVFYGGDLTSMSTSTNLCGLAAPAEQFRVHHTYQHGVLATSEHMVSSTVGIGFKHLDRTIDKNTGLTVSSRDTAGLQTTFDFDALGRVTWVKPPSGHDGWTQYSYLDATSTQPAKVRIWQRDGHTTSAIVEQSELHFDPFGRLWREKRLLPSGLWATRETGYNAIGWRTYQTEWETATAPVERTSFLQYDPFGRPGIIRPPEGSVHDVAFTYVGVRRVERTAKVALSRDAAGAIVETPIKTTEVYDTLGRLWRVWEDDGVTAWKTEYAYDPHDRLKRVTQARPEGTQQRTFNYDGRGVLFSECHPEKGSFGNGCVSYHQADALGRPTRVVDGPQDVTLTYDRAQRLTEARETTGAARVLSEYVYVNGTSFDWSRGKLRTATQHNYFPEFGGLDFPVAETYTYSGTGGRVSRLETRINANDVYLQDYTWNRQGRLSQHRYPSCTHCGTADGPTRWHSYGYTQGQLTSVPGWASSITYHPNGLYHQISHANGTVTTQANGPDGTARPGEISVWKGATPLYLSGQYQYDGSGNVAKIGQDYYLYDRLGRLVEGTMFQDGQNRKQAYGYDGFGNLTSTTTTVNGFPSTRSVGVTWSTNRLSNASYDSAGNQLNWGSYAYAWDSQGRMRTHSWGSSQLFYAYSVDGERAMTYDGATGRSTFRIRGLDGKTLREFSHVQGGGWSWQKDWIYRDGQLLGTDSAALGLRHAHNDHLGTPRVFSDVFGNYQERRHLYPFGEQALATGPAPVTMTFTGHERDGNWTTATADDLDYMMARYYHPQLGRFLSVDPGRDFDRQVPQSWNQYVYVRNNPMVAVDPDGEAFDFVLDIGLALYDLFDIGRSLVNGNGVSKTQIVALGADVASIFIPFGTGGGPLVRAAANAQDLNRVTKVAADLTSKASARKALSEAGLTAAQEAGARKAVSRTTTSEVIDIYKNGDDLIVNATREGFDGRQVIQTVVSPDGTKQVTQLAFDSSGKLVHVDPKTPKIVEQTPKP